MVGALLIAPFMASTTASAEGSCQIGYTGPNSDNLCVSTTTYECTINNNNTVTVINDNTQVSLSGDANNEGNDEGSSVQTGSATNNNNVTFDVTVTNGEDCTVVATVPVTTTPTPTPVTTTPTVKQAVPAPAKSAAPVLANTFGDSTTGFVAGLLSVTALGLVTLKIALASYARRQL